MSRTELLKKLLPGFIPLFVFIAADEIWGTKIGLMVAVGVGVAEMIYVGIRERRLDKFILFDTLLLVLLGAVSILLDNAIFFKLKPGLIELILLAVLGVSAFSGFNLIGAMGKRYLKDVQLQKEQEIQLRKSLKVLFFIVAGHLTLVFYASFYMSKEAWAFISGGLFYLLFGVYFVVELLRQKMQRKKIQNEEWVPLVTENGRVSGQAPRSQVHNGSKLLHPVVHMHVINPSNKAILLQRRPMEKLIQPGKWDTAVGGHISAGETVEQALRKEAWEEIGLKEFSARLHHQYVWESEVEKELVYLFVTHNYKNWSVHSDEVVEARFWTPNQIKTNLNKEVFTPNLEHELAMLAKAGVI